MILLDCDGVLANFIQGAINWFGMQDKVSHDDITYFGFYEDWGMSEDEFWSDLRGEEFWLSLEPYPWAQKIIQFLNDNSYDFVISTSPTRDPDCVSAKLKWLKIHLDIPVRKVMVGKQKHLMAKNGLLIDDSEKNVSKFREFGGKAVLFPQPSNTAGVVLKNFNDSERWQERWKTALNVAKIMLED